MEKLKNASRFYYQSKDVFKDETDDVHAFPRADFETGMHMQEFFEINIITRGSGIHYIEDSHIETCVGDVFIIPPKIKHGFKGGRGFDVFHVLISNRFMEKNMSDLQSLPSFFKLFAVEPMMRGKSKNPLHLRLTSYQFENLNNMLSEACRYRNLLDPFDRFARKGFAVLLVSFLCRVYTQHDGDVSETKEGFDEAFFKAVSYIHEHYFEKISIDMLAKMARLSRSTFIRRFTEVCKMPPSDYIIKCRIEASEYMLVNTSNSLLDIAFKCGFYDAAHFSKIFRKKKGILPSEYRKKIFEG